MLMKIKIRGIDILLLLLLIVVMYKSQYYKKVLQKLNIIEMLPMHLIIGHGMAGLIHYKS